MTDQIEEEEIVETTEDTTGAEPEKKTERVFSETQVQKLIAERLNREKLSAKKLATELTQRETDYQTQLEAYENVIEKFLEKEMKLQSDSVQKLLAKLPVLERLEFLSDSANKIDKKLIPNTPNKGTESEKPPKKLGVFL